MEDGITRYRVSDVVLFSAGDLTALATALEARGMAVTQRALDIAETDRMWVFQVGCEQLPDDDLEAELAMFVAAVESLEPPERAAWASCSKREFDIAFDCGIKPGSVRHELSAGLLSRLVAVGGSLKFTLYSLDPREIPPDDVAAE
jgi:hypothetical protein